MRERDRRLVDEKKRQVLATKGKLVCEGCDFDFSSVYGELAASIMDVHHTVPLYATPGSRKTKLEDLALLCANCHRVVHSRRKWLTIDELRAVIAA